MLNKRKEQKINMKILVTGGCGFIGSHTCVELLENGYDITIIDNLCNSKADIVDKIKSITHKDFTFYEGDLRNKELLTTIFEQEKIDAVIHFAGLKAVNESVKKPLMYYDNNLTSTLTLLEVMEKFNCKNIVFSSSSTVYGVQECPLIESMERKKTTNPYGETKSVIERIMEDLYHSDPTWTITLLRYFNPVGAHESGLIGEDPNGIPNNLMPYILKVATQELPQLTIYGNDYPTEDGTCIRDYIHVVDLAKGHLAALNHAHNHPNNIFTYNLGSGKGISVTEIVTTFEKVNNIKLNYVYGPRREGDIPIVYADPSKALKELNWQTTKTLEDMCKDSYHYIISNKAQK